MTIALHKPRNVISTVSDPAGRLTVLDLVPDQLARLYPVGRLDYDSEGLILLTSDGGLAASLLHPRHALPRRYALLVTPRPSETHLARLREGVRLSDGPAHALGARRLLTAPRAALKDVAPRDAAWLELILTEGRQREARRMCGALSLEVIRLVRVAFGSVELAGLGSGEWRHLAPAEISALRGRPTQTSARRRS